MHTCVKYAPKALFGWQVCLWVGLSVLGKLLPGCPLSAHAHPLGTPHVPSAGEGGRRPPRRPPPQGAVLSPIG